MSKSKVSEPVQAIRQALSLDTWGADIMRLKSRLGWVIEHLHQLHADVVSLRCEVNQLRAEMRGDVTMVPPDPYVAASISQFTWNSDKSKDRNVAWVNGSDYRVEHVESGMTTGGSEEHESSN